MLIKTTLSLYLLLGTICGEQIKESTSEREKKGGKDQVKMREERCKRVTQSNPLARK